MILNGESSPWSSAGYRHITIYDFYGNEYNIPILSFLSLAFSLANMLRSAIYFNVRRIHGSKRVKDKIYLLPAQFLNMPIISGGYTYLTGKAFDHLPFLVASFTFRLVSTNIVFVSLLSLFLVCTGKIHMWIHKKIVMLFLVELALLCYFCYIFIHGVLWYLFSTGSWLSCWVTEGSIWKESLFG